jgi:hypothetical protein
VCVSEPDLPVMVMVEVPDGVEAPVWMLRLDMAEPVFGEMPEGENWHFAPEGNPEQVRLTLLLKLPPTWVAVTTSFAFWPAFTVRSFGEAESVKSSPLPLREMVCGLPKPLSTTRTAPEASPPAMGLKLTVILQLDPLLSDEGQLLETRNGPVTEMEEIARGPGPFAVNLMFLPPL